MSTEVSLIDNLINKEDAFCFSSEADELFFKAMKEAFVHQYHSCSSYRKLCHREGFTPDKLRCYNDVKDIPYIFVAVFKERVLKCVPDEEIILTLTSSGTSGRRSAIYLDRISLERVKKIARNVYASYGLVNEKAKVNYLCFTYELQKAKHIGTAFTDELLMSFTDVNNAFFALRYDPQIKDYYFDRKGCLEAISNYSSQGYPLRILGFPAYIHAVIEEIEKNSLPLRFGSESYVLMGGGWKTLADKEIPREEFRLQVATVLGIPPQNIRDLFGMVEHGIPYVECECFHMHIPIYGRVYLREPGSMKFLKPGEIGIFQFLTPYIRSFPSISLLSSDIGTIGENCPCGRNSPYIEVKGRGGIKKLEGCAISALEFLKRIS